MSFSLLVCQFRQSLFITSRLKHSFQASCECKLGRTFLGIGGNVQRYLKGQYVSLLNTKVTKTTPGWKPNSHSVTQKFHSFYGTRLFITLLTKASNTLARRTGWVANIFNFLSPRIFNISYHLSPFMDNAIVGSIPITQILSERLLMIHINYLKLNGFYNYNLL